MAGRKLFDCIAPIYSRYFDFQKRMYQDALQTVASGISLDAYETILDVGCGTGAFAAVMLARGFTVTGIDTSEKMLQAARRKVMHPSARFLHADGGALPFTDGSFDIVFSSYVLHGLQPDERKNLYREMKRVAKHLVIVHDYNQTRSITTSIVEWAERGDYFRFIQAVEEEMRAGFSDLRVIPAADKANWYVGEI
ncbi:MAG: class I SAM-dependent methyltransferase [Tissierellia bacterium]|nr:class I SAM-dependent methyltransferase [Tissierellia bacterium]